MSDQTPNGFAAHRLVSQQEARLATLADLGWAVVMTAQSTTGMEEHYASALCRLGMLIIEQAEAAEKQRRETSSHLYGYAYPDGAKTIRAT